MDICKVIIKVKNRITNNLAGTMVSNIATAVDLVKSSTFCFQPFFVYQQVFFVAAFAQGIHMRVRAEQQVIWSWFLLTLRRIPVLAFKLQYFVEKLTLVIPGLLVIYQAKVLKQYFFIF